MKLYMLALCLPLLLPPVKAQSLTPDLTITCPHVAPLAGVPMPETTVSVTGAAGRVEMRAFGLSASGMHLSTDGVITGTPRIDGLAFFTIIANADGASATKNCALLVQPRPQMVQPTAGGPPGLFLWRNAATHGLAPPCHHGKIWLVAAPVRPLASLARAAFAKLHRHSSAA